MSFGFVTWLKWNSAFKVSLRRKTGVGPKGREVRRPAGTVQPVYWNIENKNLQEAEVNKQKRDTGYDTKDNQTTAQRTQTGAEPTSFSVWLLMLEKALEKINKTLVGVRSESPAGFVSMSEEETLVRKLTSCFLTKEIIFKIVWRNKKPV